MLRMVKSMVSGRLSRFLAVAAALVITASWSHAELRSEPCQAVEIESAGRYMIQRSKIRQIGTTHNRAGIAILVSIWPPSENSSESDVEEIDIMASFRDHVAANCQKRVFHPQQDVVVCSQNIPGFAGLQGIVRFKMGGTERYEERTESIIKYLANEVLGCGASGQRI